MWYENGRFHIFSLAGQTFNHTPWYGSITAFYKAIADTLFVEYV